MSSPVADPTDNEFEDEDEATCCEFGSGKTPPGAGTESREGPLLLEDPALLLLLLLLPPFLSLFLPPPPDSSASMATSPSRRMETPEEEEGGGGGNGGAGSGKMSRILFHYRLLLGQRSNNTNIPPSLCVVHIV